MFYHNILLPLILSTSNIDSLSLNPYYNYAKRRLIGGKVGNIIAFPYQAQIEVNGIYVCGGVIIDRFIILSVAHCFHNGLQSNTTVRVGTSILGGHDGMVIHVNQIRMHEDYGKNINPYDYDIAILWLAQPLELSKYIQPILLPKRTDKIPKDVTFYVPGWGVETEGDAKYSIQLKFIKIKFINWQVCNSTYEGLITQRMFCAGDLNGVVDACQGDSGGAFVYANILYGIVSWGLGCGRNQYPGLYTNIIMFRDWIYYKAGI